MKVLVDIEDSIYYTALELLKEIDVADLGLFMGRVITDCVVFMATHQELLDGLSSGETTPEQLAQIQNGLSRLTDRIRQNSRSENGPGEGEISK